MHLVYVIVYQMALCNCRSLLSFDAKVTGRQYRLHFRALMALSWHMW